MRVREGLVLKKKKKKIERGTKNWAICQKPTTKDRWCICAISMQTVIYVQIYLLIKNILGIYFCSGQQTGNENK